jgi:site-specific DNA-methyltransferase (adenine-specific)
MPNLLIRADSVDVARALPDGCLDLIYLDPPFGTGRGRRMDRGRGGRRVGRWDDSGDPRGREQEIGSSADRRVAFADPRTDGTLQPWLTELLAETPRLLRRGGALFLHLDYRRAHHARRRLDAIYGEGNFLNEIIWRYATGGVPRSAFARKHDTILYYRNGPGHTFHRLREKKRLAHRMGRRGVEEFEDAEGWYRFRYLDDVWEIPWLTQDARERTGYPTQKPLALLERILAAATDPGMRIADFCCGSGTAAVAAERTGRRWIAADCSRLAVRIARRRLESLGGLGFSVLEGAPAADSGSGGFPLFPAGDGA